MNDWLQSNKTRLASLGAVLAASGALYGLLGFISKLVAIAFISALLQSAIVLIAFFAYTSSPSKPFSPVPTVGEGESRLRSLVLKLFRPSSIAPPQVPDPVESGERNRHGTVIFGIDLLALALFILAVLVTGLRPPTSSASALVSGLWIPFAGALLATSRILRYLPDLNSARDYFQTIARFLVGAAIVGLGGGVLALAVGHAVAVDPISAVTSSASSVELFIRAYGETLSLVAEGGLICALGVAFTSAALDDVGWLSISIGVMAGFFGAAEWLSRAQRYGVAVLLMGALAIIFGVCVFVVKTPRRLTQGLLVIIGMASVAVAVFALTNDQPELAVSLALLSVSVLAYAVALNVGQNEPEASRRLEMDASAFAARLSVLHLQARWSGWVAIRFLLTVLGLLLAGFVCWQLALDTQRGATIGFLGVTAALFLIVFIQVLAFIRGRNAS